MPAADNAVRERCGTPTDIGNDLRRSVPWRPLEELLRCAGATGDELDEVRQLLRARLLLPSETGPPRLVDYCGAGRLRRQLRVVATRALVNLRSGYRFYDPPGGRRLRGPVATMMDSRRPSRGE